MIPLQQMMPMRLSIGVLFCAEGFWINCSFYIAGRDFLFHAFAKTTEAIVGRS